MPNWLIHLAADAVVIFVFLKISKNPEHKQWIIWGILLSNFIDIDHLLAKPIYDPARCGINFHPLHSVYLLPLYILSLLHPKLRYVGVGIILHILLDWIDCLNIIF